MANIVAKNWEPREYMQRAVKFCLDHAVGALWLSPGLGKTSISLAVISFLLKAKTSKAAFIVAPLHVCYNSWPGEIKKWKQFSHLKHVILHGPDKADLLRTKADIYLINPEGLLWLYNELSKMKLKELPFDVLFIDESSKFKHGNTQRFKIMKRLMGFFRRRYELTGTPAPNGLMDVWSQIFLLDEGKALGRFITHYRMNYFNQTGYGGYTYVLIKGADKKIYKALDGLVLRMDAKDWLQLPPLVINDIKVQLPGPAFQNYRTMEQQLLAIVNGETSSAVNAAAAGNKCLQIAGGGVYLDDDYNKESKDRRWADVHSAKLEALEDLVDQQEGEPMLIAYWFHHEQERLAKAYPKAPFIGRGTSPKRAKEIIDLWNQGQVPLLFANPVSISHGLNMQGTHAAVCFYSMIWDLEAYEQFIQRVHRQGQEARVMVHRIIAEHTLDEDVVTALKKKGRTQDRLLDALKERTRER